MFINYPIQLNDVLVLPSSLKQMYKVLKYHTNIHMKPNHQHSNHNRSSRSQQQRGGNGYRKSRQSSNILLKNKVSDPFLLKKYPKYVELPMKKNSYLFDVIKLTQRRKKKSSLNFLIILWNWLKSSLMTIRKWFFCIDWLPKFDVLKSLLLLMWRKSDKNKNEESNINSNKRRFTSFHDFQLKSMIFNENDKNIMGYYQFLFSNYCHAFIPLPQSLQYIPDTNRYVLRKQPHTVWKQSDQYAGFGHNFVEIVSELWFSPRIKNSQLKMVR